MAGRRAITEGAVFDEDDGFQIDLNGLNDDERNAALAMAYALEDNDSD
jgi:hypothetical protein